MLLTMIRRPNFYDYLKILAIVTMIIDHVWFLFFPDMMVLRIIGRTAFPLFLFLVGWNHSYKRRNDLWIRWIALQCVLWIGLWWWFTEIAYLNILLAIWLTRVVLRFVQRINLPAIEILLFIVSCIAVRWTYPLIDYGTMSLVFGLLWYRSRRYWSKRYIWICIVLSVGYHMLFMVLSRWYNAPVLLTIIWWVLIYFFIQMSTTNRVLLSKNKKWDRALCFVSSQALHIYVLQAVLLSILYVLVSFW